VRKGGLEPPRLSAPPPQDGVSANSTTSARQNLLNLNMGCVRAWPNLASGDPSRARTRPALLTCVTCIATLYGVIISFRHRGIERFFRTGSKAGIQPKHADRLRLQLFALDNARRAGDMNAPGWKLHPLSGELKDHWSVSVSGNWRLTFKFDGEDATLVDYQDYH